MSCRTLATLWVAAATLTIASCSNDLPEAGCVSAADCPTGQACVGGRCVDDVNDVDAGGSDGGAGGADAGAREGDASCDGQIVPFDYRPPNVLLIFDRSCSMRRRLDDLSAFGTGPDDPRTRWSVAVTAVRGLLSRYGSRAFWGLMAYPDPREGCGTETSAEVPPGPGTRTAIEASLSSELIQPFGLCGVDNTDTTTQPRETPTRDALVSAAALGSLSSSERSGFVIVVTDGDETCADNAALTAVTGGLRSSGVPVAVVGFATGGGVDSLEAIATAGGLAAPGGSPSYYTAEDMAGLDAVFGEIVARVVPCEFPLASTPMDPDSLFVVANDLPLEQDPSNGWSYEAGSNRLVLHGAACDALRNGDITRLRIGEGCASTECEPTDEVCNGLDDDCDDRVDEDCLL